LRKASPAFKSYSAGVAPHLVEAAGTEKSIKKDVALELINDCG